MIEQILDRAVRLLWGRGTLALTLLCGLYFTVCTGCLPFVRLPAILRKTLGSLFNGHTPQGGVSPFAAVSTALGGTMGVGNIVGVGAALALGGPGCILWMWVGALLGMSTKYMEVFLAVRWRQKDAGARSFRGGPMYYLSRGLPGPLGRVLAVLFCIFCALASFTSGSMTQTNAIALSLQESFSLPVWLCAAVLTVLCGWVLAGGCDRAVKTCCALVPAMSLFYLAGCGCVLFYFRENLSQAVCDIFTQAFASPAAGIAGAGAGLLVSMRVGIARGIFTHEAGLGSASIAHACSGAASPVEQGFWGIVEVFCDTILVCTVTALAILASGVTPSGFAAQQAFVLVMGAAGGRVLSVAITLFAFASVISFCLYGQRCIEFLFADSHLALKIYKLLFLAGCAAGCFLRLPLVFSLADLLNACLLIPNLIAMVLLSPQVFRATRQYFLKGEVRSCSSVRSNPKHC